MDKLKQKTENKKQNKNVQTSNDFMGISGTEGVPKQNGFLPYLIWGISLVCVWKTNVKNLNYLIKEGD